jgi:hypothetical protein
MTPKEKAQELVLKYLRIENTNDWWAKVPAKQCTLIAVDELIDCTTNGLGLTKFSKEYWQQVKTEIEKL